ncbi:hypothetical protein M0R45_020524 [Rubus argutus]|uniref:Pentatricopeptide repeat-containing protein n=1 Tax=Rubus argutus TaxID=59490 RepID=A0AAW1X8M0_RUBAR
MKMKLITAGNRFFITPFLLKRIKFYSVVAESVVDRSKARDLERLIQTRCKSGTLGLDEALGYFNSMIQMKPIPSIRALNCLFGALSKMKQYCTVVSMYKQLMGCAHFQPDVFTMNVVINCLCRLNRVDLGFSALAITLKHGLQPDACSLNPLLHGLCKNSSSLGEGVDMFQKMGGCACDEFTYAIIINGLCKAGKTSNVMEILEQSALISSHCKEDRMEEALSLFEMMTRKGIQPDVVTFTCLISAFCKSGKWEEAVQIFKNMIECGTLPNVCTFNAILDALCKEGKTSEALSLMEEMIHGGVKPDISTYNSLINGLCHSGQWRETTRLFDEMVGLGILPDTITLTALFDAFCKEGMTEEAHKAFEAAFQYGMEVSKITYNMLVNQYCLHGKTDKAKKVFNFMLLKGHVPDNASYTTLVNGYIKVKRIDEAVTLVKEMIQKGVMPDLETQKALGDFCPKMHISSAD